MLNATTEHEKESLEAHVDLCAIRYESLDNRLTKVEEKIEALHTAVKQNNATTMKALIGAVATIIVALIGAVATIISSMPV
jgi:tetrahydromethanopterin S-methyltransferase subunit G